MAIYFDMDGVLADFKAGVDATGAPYVGPETQDKKADDAMWDRIKATQGFYRTLPEIPAGVDLFKSLQRAGADPEILTAVPKPKHGMPQAGPDKQIWVDEHLGPGVETHICLRAEKISYCKGPEDVLIDDQDRNIREWREAGGTGVLFGPNGACRLPPRLELMLKSAAEQQLGPGMAAGPELGR